MKPDQGWLEIIEWLFALKRLSEPNHTNADWIPVLAISFIVMIAVWFLLGFRSKRNAFQSWITGIVGSFTGLSHEDMAAEFDSINEKLNRDEHCGHQWREFDATLVKRKNVEGHMGIFRTVDAQYFFNESSLIEPNLNLRLYNAVPGILTGLGILGTFVGLSYGLSGIDFQGDSVVLRNGVQRLLAGAGTAFSTSLWGIGLSIFFSLYEKKQVHGLNKEIQRFQDAIIMYS